MKEYHTHSDVGCFLFGNKDFSFKLPNSYGDGRNTVLLFEDYTEYENHIDVNTFDWVMDIEGDINLYINDCCAQKKENVLLELNGKYTIYLKDSYYRDCPVLAIVKEE